MKNMKPRGKSLKECFVFHILFLLLCVTSGCGNKFFDPSQVGRFDHTPAVSVILDRLGPTEELPVPWEQGEEPRPIDTVPKQSDYTLTSGDYIEIEIHELLMQGVTYTKNFEVSETGRISIPVVGELLVKGMTETQIEEVITKKLEPDILVDPVVHVTLVQSQHRAYSIQGDGVPKPNRYSLPRYPLKLLDALALAGSANQKNVSYIYVTRKEPKSKNSLGLSQNNTNGFQSSFNLEEPLTRESIRNRTASSNSPISTFVVSSTEMVLDRNSRESSRNINRYRYHTAGRLASTNAYQFSEMQDGSTDIENRVSVDEVLNRVSGQTGSIRNTPARENVQERNNTMSPREGTVNTTSTKRTEWKFMNGEYVPVEVETLGGTVTRPSDQERNLYVPEAREGNSDPDVDWVLQGGRYVPVSSGQNQSRPQPQTPINNNYNPIGRTETNNNEPEFVSNDQETETRLIKIPVDRLLAGDPRYDIVIRPGDSILVPLDVAGEYFLMGNLNSPGRVEMTGGKVTLKQAIATAGNLNALAWPERCEITRRIGDNEELTVRVDLDKIFNGEQPDIYIKPNDIINVGTHATSIWRAVLKNSFRAAYGFGFVYDRNFAIDDYYSTPWSK